MVWAIVMDRRVTLQEVESYWSYEDVLECYYRMMKETIEEYKQVEEINKD